MRRGMLNGKQSMAKHGVEKARAAKREGDTRPKPGLVPVKRLELARRWLLAFLQQMEALRCRKLPMQVVLPKYAITTDASPFVVGAILSVVDKEQDNLTPTVALAGKITKNVAAVLGVEFRQASGQAVLEAFAVLLVIRYWRATLRGSRLLLKADSTVALALSKKLSSSTATLNFIGAELNIVLEGAQMQDLVAHHLPGKLNVEADYLSRPDLQVSPPDRLKDLSVRHLNEAWMLESQLPPPGVEPQLWGMSAVYSCM